MDILPDMVAFDLFCMLLLQHTFITLFFLFNNDAALCVLF